MLSRALRLSWLQPRDRAQQRLGVGVAHGTEQTLGGRGLDDPAGIHDVDPVGSPATTPMSCVTSRVAMPRRSLRSSSSARICAWIVTSSAVVGSSASRTLGSQASAIAIITRWRSPPES